MINRDKLQEYANALIAFELTNHHVDLHRSLNGSTFRITNNEGYKYTIINYWKNKRNEPGSYTTKVYDAIGQWNLADDRQKDAIENKLLKTNPANLELALETLFTEKKDKDAFNMIVSAVGQKFDVLGLIYFLHDPSKYMPIRSIRFDNRFHLLGLNSGLAFNCTWEKYQEYNDLLREIQEFLIGYINPDITLIDAHSFVWLIEYLDAYKKSEYRFVRHKTLGRGYVESITNDTVTIIFDKDGKKHAFELKTFYDPQIFQLYKVDLYTGKLFFEKVSDQVEELNEEIDDNLNHMIDSVAAKMPATEGYKGGIKAPPPAEIDKKRKFRPRDPVVAFNALAIAGFRCEIDPEHATFKRKSNGLDYTEAHHLVPMAYQDYFEKQSLDREENIVSLCSNCHNEIHYGENAGKLVAQLFDKRKNLLESVGIDISIEQLMKLYD